MLRGTFGTDEMREASAGGEVVDEAPSPREIGEDDTGLDRHERGTERPEDPVERCGIRSCCAGKVTRLTKSSALTVGGVAEVVAAQSEP